MNKVELPTRLSSRWILFQKCVFGPILCALPVVGFVLVVHQLQVAHPHRFLFIVIETPFLVFATYGAWKGLQFLGQLHNAHVFGDDLEVSGIFQRERIPLTDVVEVSLDKSGLEWTILLEFSRPTVFGKSVRFLPRKAYYKDEYMLILMTLKEAVADAPHRRNEILLDAVAANPLKECIKNESNQSHITP